MLRRTLSVTTRSQQTGSTTSLRRQQSRINAQCIVHSPFSSRSNRVVHSPSTSSLSLSSLWNRLLSIPKGFRNYYPKGSKGNESAGGRKAAEDSAKRVGTQSESANFKSKSGFRGGGQNGGDGGGSGGGGGPSVPPEMLALLLATGVGAAYYLGQEKIQGSKEISWQEFSTVILESGQIDRLIVSNKKIAKVVLRASPSESSNNTAPGSPSPKLSGNEADYTDGDYRIAVDPEQTNTPDGHPPSPAKFIRYPRIGTPQETTTPFHFAIGSVESFERKLEEAQKNLGISPRDFIPVVYADDADWAKEAMSLAPTLIFVGLYFAVMRGIGRGGMGGGAGGLFNIGKSNAKKINKEMVTTSFKDVAGCDEAKREIVEFVDFLKDSSKFTNLGAKIPKGALLCGPPGTGKTLLAKATAGEASVPFFSCSGSDFVEMFVGVGASRVRDLFKEARANAPCIVFIDEIDAVGRARGKGRMQGGNDERENTLNQLLVEMDGFDASSNIVILAGTNRADVLDKALLRPGRFDRQIQVEKPDIQGRKSIFEVHLAGIKLSDVVGKFSSRLAALTPGFSGADIANICNEAAIIAARSNKVAVEMVDFESATDRVIGGLESKKLISPHEKKVVAYHEAGHAVAGWNLEYADPLLKVTIVARAGGALGFAQYLPKEIFLRTKEQILDTVCMALAGRAAEQILIGNYTTGASDDLRRVTQIVYQMVQQYGMNESIGQLAFPQDDGGGFPGEKMYSPATAEKMDKEVKAIVDEAYKRTLLLIEEKKEQVVKVAELLIERETITHNDVADLIGARPYSAGKEYDEFVSGVSDIKNNDVITEDNEDKESQEEEEESSENDGGSGSVVPPIAFGFTQK